MKDVFISYKNEEFDEANWVRMSLETNGVSCWMAPMSIPGGSSYAAEIPNAIRECKVFVLLLSEKAQESKWVPRELDQAINAGKIVLPFMLENCQLKDDFNFYLTNVQRYAAYESKAKAMEKMLAEIKAILSYSDNNDSGLNIIDEHDTQNFSEELDEEHPSSFLKDKTLNKKSCRKQRKTCSGIKKSLKLPLAIAILFFIFVLVFVLILVIKSNNTIMIAGNEFDRNDPYISIYDKNLTAEDIKEFENFKEIKSLTFTNCAFESNGMDAVCERVQYSLTLDNCQITNDFVSNIDFSKTSISRLDLSNNPNLSDIESVCVLKDALEVLDISYCSFNDISFLENFAGLRELKADNNKIKDIYSLSLCSELNSVSLANNEIDSLKSLSNCTKLREVNVDNNLLTELDGLENAISLSVIHAENNSITELNGIINATVLNDVKLSGNKIEDFSVLNKSKDSLSVLYLGDNNISDISFLSEFKNITELSIENNKIRELNALGSMKSLKKLNAHSNLLSDVSGVKLLLGLEYIDLSDNDISNVELSLYTAYTASSVYLDLSNNKLSKLQLPSINYKFLALYGNQINDLSSINTYTGNELVFDYNEDIDYTKLANSNFYHYYIFNCPLDKQLKLQELFGEYSIVFTTEKEFLDNQSSLS